MRLILTALFAVIIGTASPAQDGGAAIRNTIQGQFDAFLADDVAKAFGFAAPTIQGIFGSPERFGEMVRNGYPMVWRPAEVKYLDLHPKRGGLWQRVMITDTEGQVHFLDYEMIATPEGIRIGGVEILQAPDLGA